VREASFRSGRFRRWSCRFEHSSEKLKSELEVIEEQIKARKMLLMSIKKLLKNTQNNKNQFVTTEEFNSLTKEVEFQEIRNSIGWKANQRNRKLLSSTKKKLYLT
jgi:hypothetical protein